MPLTLSTIIAHFGMLDGSAGFAINDDLFVAASDEENVFHVCSVKGGLPEAEALDLNSDALADWFKPGKKKLKPGKKQEFKEADIESATKLGGAIYWIASHARDSGKEAKNGKPDEEPQNRPERHRLFATRLVESATPKLNAEGEVAYDQLLGDITGESLFAKFDLKTASEKAPKVEGGFNIESLCAANDESCLFIGLRNPIPHGKALLLPLTNAPTLVAGTAKKATFDKAIDLDLHGLGFRDMIWWPAHKCYLIIGGHYDEHMSNDGAPRPALFTWSGKAGDDPVMHQVVGLGELNPEGLVLFPNGRILILSDDGALKDKDGVSQKDRRDAGTPLSQLSFRSAWLEGNP